MTSGGNSSLIGGRLPLEFGPLETRGFGAGVGDLGVPLPFSQSSIVLIVNGNSQSFISSVVYRPETVTGERS